MKKTAIFVILIMIIQLIPLECFTAFANEQPPPTNLAVAVENGQPVISYSPEKGHYVKLNWTAPTAWSGDEQHLELHYRAENDSVYQLYGSIINKDKTEIEMNNLKSGTVYYAHVHAVHEHTQLDGQPAQTHDTQSNEIIFVTDTNIAVEPGENGTLDIIWDRVNYNAASVSCDVYISESASFAETSSIHVSSEDIGEGKAVYIEGDKLVYNAADLKSGTIYYVKIRTSVDDGRVTCRTVSLPAAGFTNIRAEISKISSEWWKLKWDAITNTNLSENEGVLYKICRCVDGDLEKEIAATKDTGIQVKVSDDNTYFKVKADLVSQLGTNLSIVSERIYAQESEIIAAPPVPVILQDSSEQHTEIGSRSITLLWEAPYTFTNKLDTDVSYDIWLLDGQEDIDNDDIDPVEEDFEPQVTNYVYELIGNMQGTRVVGYKYIFSNLEPNKVYYLKMKAKKTFDMDGIPYTVSSEPALKILVTLPDGAIDQPVVPSVPPFKVKTQTVNGKEVQVTTKNSVTLQWKNQWYEVWNSSNSKWQFLADEDVNHAAVAGDVYRLISYDSGVKFSVGYEVYSEGFDFTRLMETTSPMPMQFKDIPNSTGSATVEFTASGLQPNTSYVMWMRAYRSDSLKSNLSDPVIVSTRPAYESPIHKPAVPKFSAVYAGDTYTEFSWSLVDNYYYILKYGTEDDISKASKSIEIAPDDMKNKTKYKVEDLMPDTVYYFWIKAKVMGEGVETEESDWNDSYYVKTLPYSPPEVPSGFGIKNINEPIGKDFVCFDWIAVNGLEYTLEIAKKSDFSDVTSYDLKNVSEYKVEKLQPNTRYYVRLYAYDPVKKLKSNYTSTVSVKTLKSNDEYDTGADTDISGGKIPKPGLDEEDEDLAVLDVKYEKTDIFIEAVYNDLNNDYTINFAGLNPDESSKTKHPEGVENSKTRISPRILIALEQKKKNLIVDNGPAVLIIKPGIMQNQSLKQQFKDHPDSMLEIALKKESSSSYKSTGGTYISDIWQASVSLETTAGKNQFPELSGLKMKVPYYDVKWFDKSAMSGCIYDTINQKWLSVQTSNSFDTLYSEGAVYSTLPGSCSFAVMKVSGGKFSDISGGSYSTEIKAITDKYNLKCLGNGLFEPSKIVVKEEAVKILLDVLNYNYDDDYLSAARKAGITTNIDMADTAQSAAKEETAAMIVRVYEILTGNKASSNTSLARYSDWRSVNSNLSARVAFAVENKIIDASGGLIDPKGSFSRGQMMVMLKSMLEKAGVF